MTILFIYVGIVNLGLCKLKLKQLLFMLITGIVTSYMLVITLNNFIVLMFVLVLVPMSLVYMVTKNILESVVSSIVPTLIIIITDYITSSVSVYFFHIDYLSKNLKLYFEVCTIEFVFIFIVSKILGTLINRKMQVSNLKIKGRFSFLIIVSSVLTLIIMYTNIILQNRLGFQSDIININALMFSLYFIMLIIVMYILFTNIKKDLELKHKQGLYENLHEYTDNLEKLYVDTRKFKHDYTNILSSLIGYMEDSDMEGLKRYFNEKIMLLERKMESNVFKLGSLKNIEIPEIKGILSSKLIRAQSLGIDIHVEITQAIQKINMDILDICRIMGILMDNAIEASQECSNSFIKLAVINREYSVIIIINNSCIENMPPIHKIYKEGFSTKGNNRGLGLNILKDITIKYENVYLDTQIKHGKFRQQLEIGEATGSAGVVNA